MIRVGLKPNSTVVLDALTNPFIPCGPPEYTWWDSCPDLIARKVRDWITALGAKAACIEPCLGELIPQISSDPPCPPERTPLVRASRQGPAMNSRMESCSTACRNPNSNRTKAGSLQQNQTAQLIGKSPARAGTHRSNRPEADHASTIKPDHQMGPHDGRSHGPRSRCRFLSPTATGESWRPCCR